MTERLRPVPVPLRLVLALPLLLPAARVHALSSCAKRRYATQAWSNATLSVYPATTGAEQWICLDNAGLQETPSAAPLGTEYVESGATLPVAALRTNQ